MQQNQRTEDKLTESSIWDGKFVLRDYVPGDLPAVLDIWNEVVEEGGSFPFMEKWSPEQLAGFLKEQTWNGVAEDSDSGEVVGFVTVHPNIVGRCSSGANATYLVRDNCRGKHIGERLVKASIRKARELGFRYMQFNGVVDSNIRARHLYERCGFTEVGVIPKGFQVKDGHYEDMHIMYLDLEHTYGFYGWKTADCAPKDPEIRVRVKDPRQLYDLLLRCWTRETCAPRLRPLWSEENITVGQCSITAYLVQDLFGGKVYGIRRPDGNFHCYNDVDGCVFDLTSEQFGEEAKKLVYENNPEQRREDHFAKREKYERYLLLKERLEKLIG